MCRPHASVARSKRLRADVPPFRLCLYTDNEIARSPLTASRAETAPRGVANRLAAPGGVQIYLSWAPLLFLRPAAARPAREGASRQHGGDESDELDHVAEADRPFEHRFFSLFVSLWRLSFLGLSGASESARRARTPERGHFTGRRCLGCLPSDGGMPCLSQLLVSSRTASDGTAPSSVRRSSTNARRRSSSLAAHG